jgi:hypothetical protein
VNTPSRFISVLVIAAVVVVAAIQITNPHSYVSEAIGRAGEVGSGPDASLTDLTTIAQIQTAFNHDAGHARLLLLFSPT